ncbi:hypothetical protein RB2150_00959 [Rhodobacterales bacterium HTCC2150]|nr:hypothetical protein RB2150_00959 [Rhodobacterales bacterium HTCC2150] [Rhodobacteraceae bacterium HTCC2150]
MSNYVGKSIQEPILDYGPPVNVVDMNDGKRAFQWSITHSGAVPIYTPQTATVYGVGGPATVNYSTTTYSPYSQTCLYTLIAVQQGKDWVVEGFRKPNLMCE